MGCCNVLSCACGKYFLPQRYILVLLTAFGVIVLYGHRLNISLIITEMVKKPVKTVSLDCPIINESSSTGKKKMLDSTYQWTEEQQGAILAAFYLGYVPAHFPAGILSDDYGARYIITTSVIMSTITTAVVPVVVMYTNWWCFAILRVLTGISQGAIMPSISGLLSCWIPKQERATMGGIVFAANSYGSVLAPLFTGLIQQFFNSWPLTFYFWAMLGLVWYIFAILYLFSTPQTHPFITEREKTYLLENIDKKEHTLKRNWLLFFKDVPMWALVFGQFGHSYLIFFLCTNMSKYFKDVLHVNLKNNTLASSLPYLLQWISSVASGACGDWMIKKKHYNVGWIRKIYTTIASVGPSLAILAIPYSGCNKLLVIVWLCLSLLFMGPFYCGLKVNVMDITKNFAALMMAFVNGLGAISGIINPNVCSKIAPDEGYSHMEVARSLNTSKSVVQSAAVQIMFITYVIFIKLRDNTIK